MYCISVSTKDLSGSKKLLQTIVKEYENDLDRIMFELRLDLMSNKGTGLMKDSEIKEFCDALNSNNFQYIVTCRELSNANKGFSEDRINMLNLGIKKNATYVDLEYEADDNYVSKLKAMLEGKTCQLIISYHNYDNTPQIHELQNIVNKSFAMGADITKIATMCQNEQDNATLLSQYSYIFDKYPSKKCIVLGMGDIGKITRVAATKLGGLLTFVSSTDEEATAPGQLSIKQIMLLSTLL